MPKTSEKEAIKKKETKEETSSEKTTKTKKLSQAQYEEKVIELAGKGLTSEKIGEELRKQGTHPKEYNKKISKILKKEEKYTNPDLKNVEEKLEKIKKHFENNKQDKRAKREKDRIFSQVRKLKKYFKVAIK